jgi:hypothetical protein
MTAIRDTNSTPEESNSSGSTMKLVTTGTLEDRARALGQRITAHDRDGREIGRDLVTLEREWTAANASGSFETWFSHESGVPRGSLYYYRNLGTALLAGLETTTTPEDRSKLNTPMVKASSNDLAAAGRALRAGKTRTEVASSLQAGNTRDVARAAETGGTVVLNVTVDGKAHLLNLAERAGNAHAEVTGGETIPQAEALEIAARVAAHLVTQPIIAGALRAEGEHESLEAAWLAGPTARLRHLETHRAISERLSRASTALLEALGMFLVDENLKSATASSRTAIRAALDELEEWTRGDDA